MMKISTFGLQNEYNETINIGRSKITGAEVEDLNSDGSPELIIFTKAAGTAGKMDVYAFSVNNKKSLSAIYFQPVANNSKIAGYKDYGEFAVVENSLVQRLPIYVKGKKNKKTRQVEYRLAEGENSRKFVVSKQYDY